MNNSTLCSASQILTPTYQGVVIGELTAAILGIAPNVLLLSAVWDLTIFPSDLRLLMGHFSFVLLLFSAGTIAKGIYLLTTRPCAYNITVRQCKMFELATGIALPNMYYALVALCIERVYATFNYRNYDKKRVPWMAMILIAIAWTTAFLVNGGGTLRYLSDDEYVPFCDGTFLPAGFANMFYVYAVIESLATLTTLLIFFYNRHIARNMAINRALYDLSARFLVDQNVQIDQILLPGMALHFIAHLPAFLILIPIKGTGAWAIPAPTRAWALRATFLWRLLYAIADPVIAFKFNTHLRQHLSRGPFGRLLKKLGIDMIKINPAAAVKSQAAAHFDYLERLWGVPKPNPPHETADQSAGIIKRQCYV